MTDPTVHQTTPVLSTDTQTTSATSTPGTVNNPNDRPYPRRVVAAGVDVPEKELWRWYLRFDKEDETQPIERGQLASMVVVLGDFARKYGFRLIPYGECVPNRYLLVTRSKWFRRGYKGMPDDQVPHYKESEHEARARHFLERQNVEGAENFEFKSLLVYEFPDLF